MRGDGLPKPVMHARIVIMNAVVTAKMMDKIFLKSLRSISPA